MWLYQHSKGELQTSFKKPKFLQVSTYQMTVLVLFNKSLIWTVEQIQDETQIRYKILLRILCVLLKIKLLTFEDISMDGEIKESDIQPNYRIKLCEGFKK